MAWQQRRAGEGPEDEEEGKVDARTDVDDAAVLLRLGLGVHWSALAGRLAPRTLVGAVLPVCRRG